MAKVLHLNTYFPTSKLYANLYATLAHQGLEQEVFVPGRIGKTYKDIPICSDLKLIDVAYQTLTDRFHYHRKIAKGLKHLEEMYRFQQRPKIILHAHTLFSDGGLAYELDRLYGIPYLVAVRNTDFHVFWKYFIHLRRYALDVLEGANCVVFLGPAYRDQGRSKFGDRAWAKMSNKVRLIPNGIDPEWFRCSSVDAISRLRDADDIKVLYVGRFDSNKNIPGLIRACGKLIERGGRVTLRLVGARGSYAEKIMKKYAHPWIQYIPFTMSTEEIRRHLAWADVFTMVSFRESFGLVYAEALSQGVPVVYSAGEGFDGWCDDLRCGRGVDPSDSMAIAKSIVELKSNFDSEACRNLARANFGWESIATQYMELYNANVCIS